MSRNFRQDARTALARAKTELESASQERLRYAALELRLSIEALTYDRAQAFATEIPPDEYDTWQPQKLLQVLLEIEPTADKCSTIRFGEEPSPGQTPSVMHTLGSETVFDLRTSKKHYSALGSFLHAPTLKQVEERGGADFVRLHDRCGEIVASLEAALASPVYNVTIGSFAQLACMECGKPVRKRFPVGREVVDVECFECHAGYRLSLAAPGKVNWEPMQQSITCPTKSCHHTFAIWNHEVKPGAHWKCLKCEHRYRISYAILPDGDEPTSAQS